MRTVSATALTAGLLMVAASPALAQPPGGGFLRMLQQPNAAMLLRDPKVQDELKLTDDQKDVLKKVGDKYQDDIRKAFMDMDMKKAQELIKSAGEEAEKALKTDQLKRIHQLEIQAAGLQAFSQEDVQAALKLTDKQKKDIDEARSELEKDAIDLFKDAQGDREKMADAFKKVMAMRKDAVDKAVDGLTDEQKKAWKDLTGDKFEFSPFGGRPPRPGGNDK